MFIKSIIEEKIGKYLNESRGYHTIDWDGECKVKVVNKNNNSFGVRRIDSNGNPLTGDEHYMEIHKGEPEYDQIKKAETANDDHDEWEEKRRNSLSGRHYHE